MNPIVEVNIASSRFKANPFPFYARLRTEAPVYRTKLPDQRNAWLVTRYEDVVALLKDDRFSKDRTKAHTQPWMPRMFKPLMRNMLDLDAPDHTRLRGLVHKVFTPRLIENLRQRLCEDWRLCPWNSPNGSEPRYPDFYPLTSQTLLN